MEKCAADIGIVGFGPVGAALAVLLGRMGVSTVVFERSSDIYPLPRAVHFDDETMRVFQAGGVAEQISKRSIVNRGMRFITASGQVLIDWPRPQDVGPQGWYASYRFHQPDVEEILRRAAENIVSNRILLRCDVFNIEPVEGAVRVHFEDLATGQIERMDCRYLVGCDGARSTVRRFMGSSLEDLGFHQKWLVVDAILKRPVADLSDWTVQYCDPVRPTTVARGVGNRRRWEFKLLPNEDPTKAVETDRVWQLLGKWIGPDDAAIERAVVYTFHSALARTWRKDRMILAGDAAHQTPPFLGQGFCAGVRDVANLAWKLAYVATKGAHESLLASYETERSSHVREYIELAIRLGGVLQGAGERDAPIGANSSMQSEVMRSIQPSLGAGLHGTAAAPAGRLAEQPLLSSGQWMDDRVGLNFALPISPTLFDSISAADRERLRANNVVVLPGEGHAYCERMGTQAILIRPDRYILGGASSPTELSKLIDNLPIKSATAMPDSVAV